MGRTQQSGLWVEREGEAFAMVPDGVSGPEDSQNTGGVGGHVSPVCDSACQDLKTAEPIQTQKKGPICQSLMEFGLH